MKKSTIYAPLLVLAFLPGLLVLPGCNPEEQYAQPSKGLGVILYLTPDMDSTYQVLALSGLAPRINKEGEFTVISPSNGAWADFIKTSDLYDSLRQERFWRGGSGFSDVMSFGYNYVITGKKTAADLTAAGAEGLGAEKMRWQIGADGRMYAYDGTTGQELGSAAILETDISMGAPNGLIHKIDRVIRHPGFPARTISGYLADSAAFSILRSAFERVPDYLKKISGGEGAFTVLAPSDSAFQVYFDAHPNYKSLDAMPTDTVVSLVNRFLYKGLIFPDLLNGNLTPIAPVRPGVTQVRSRKEYYYALDNRAYANRTHSIRATNGVIHILKQIP